MSVGHTCPTKNLDIKCVWDSGSKDRSDTSFCHPELDSGSPARKKRELDFLS